MNDITPRPVSALAEFLEKLNVPSLVAGPLGQAISRLIGGVVDIPAAKLEQVAQGIRDRTNARTSMTNALADAAAKRAVADNELVLRATNAMLARDLRGQINKEAIARKAIEYSAGAPNNDDHLKSASAPDDDWMNVFEKHAENASSERLQDLWGRVLAGEVRKRGAFSLKTLGFIAELDQPVAELFERYKLNLLMGKFLPTLPDEGHARQRVYYPRNSAHSRRCRNSYVAAEPL